MAGERPDLVSRRGIDKHLLHLRLSLAVAMIEAEGERMRGSHLFTSAVGRAIALRGEQRSSARCNWQENDLRYSALSHALEEAVMSVTINVRLEESVKDRLEQLADAPHRSRSLPAAEAIRDYVEVNEWQIGDVKAALAEADAGDFASDDDVRAVQEKWT